MNSRPLTLVCLLGASLAVTGCTVSVDLNPFGEGDSGSSKAPAVSQPPVREATAAPIPTATGKEPAIIVQVDCGEDGVAVVSIDYGTAGKREHLVGRNQTTRGAGGVDFFNSTFGTAKGYPASRLAIETMPTRGTCTTTLTDRESGDVLGEKTTAGRAHFEAVVPSID